MKILFNPGIGLQNVFAVQNKAATNPVNAGIIKPIEDKVTFT